MTSYICTWGCRWEVFGRVDVRQKSSIKEILALCICHMLPSLTVLSIGNLMSPWFVHCAIIAHGKYSYNLHQRATSAPTQSPWHIRSLATCTCLVSCLHLCDRFAHYPWFILGCTIKGMQLNMLWFVVIVIHLLTFACPRMNDFSMQVSTNYSSLGHDHFVVCCPSMMHVKIMLFIYHPFVLGSDIKSYQMLFANSWCGRHNPCGSMYVRRKP